MHAGVRVVISGNYLRDFWYRQYSVRNNAGLESTVRSLTQSMLSTYNFMSSLPRNYRHLVLQQQLELGGSQFLSR